MPTIRVLILIEASSMTGVARPLLEFARSAAADDASPRLEIAFASFPRRGADNVFTRALAEHGIPFDVIQEKRRFDPGVIAGLRRTVAGRQPDIIWSNAPKSHFLVHFSGVDRQARWLGYHHGYTHQDWKMKVFNRLDRWSLPAAARVVTVCEAFARQLVNRGVRPDRLRVQHTPIRPSTPPDPRVAAELRAGLGIDGSTRVLLSVGRLSPEKGHAVLLQAAALLRDRRQTPPWKLLIVGGGPQRETLQVAVEELNLRDNVILAGHQDSIRNFYALADLFVLPSHTEGSPNVLLEAMDAGVPVVATRVGGVPELATDGLDALLTAPGDAVQMAEAIARLLTDADLCCRLSAAARQVVMRQSPEAYYRNLRSILQEMLV